MRANGPIVQVTKQAIEKKWITRENCLCCYVILPCISVVICGGGDEGGGGGSGGG